jgi:hypothetical protein
MATQLADDGDDGQDVEVITDAGADNTPAELTPVEQLAVKMKWKPKDQYTGPEGKWKPAEEFILAEREISSGLKDTVRGLKDTVDRLAATATCQTERALKVQADEINARWERAVEEGDKTAAAAAQREMASLEKTVVSDLGNPEETFARDNPWYGKDDDATAYAQAISMREAKAGKSVEQQLAAASAGVKKRFPELFDDGEPAPAGKKPPSVNAPASRAAIGRKGTSYADLPPEAKAAANRYADLYKQKFGSDPEKSKAEYAKDYFTNTGAA